MRLLRSLPLILVSLPAAAETPIDPFFGAVGSVEIAGGVEVPLMQMPGDGAMPVVSATINGGDGDAQSMFVLSSGDFLLTVSDTFVAAHELELKTKKDKRAGEIKYVTIDSIDVGGLVLRDVTAMVSSSAVQGVPDFADQQIGMGLLQEVAYAIVRSEGVAHFAPASEGGALVAKIGGTTVEYTNSESLKVKIGKTKTHLTRQNLRVQANLGGFDVDAALTSARPDSWVQPVANRADLSAAIAGPAHQSGDAQVHWTPVTVGDSSAATVWVSTTTSTDLSALDQSPKSFLGANYLAGFDMAVDPSSRTVALAPISESKVVSALPSMIASLEAGAKTADTKAAEAAKEAGEDTKPDVGAWTALAKAYDRTGQSDKAIAAWNTVVSADDTACAAHQGLGGALWATGDLNGAAASLSTASGLYHAWWDDSIVIPGSEQADGHPAAVSRHLKPLYAQVPQKNRKGHWIPALARAAWEKQEAKGDALPDGVVPQPSSCWTSDSDLASVALAQGDGAKALEIYNAWVAQYAPLRMVLDPRLATVGANAMIADGNLQASVGHLRAAATFDHAKTDSRWALGLALAYAGQDRITSATPLFLQVLEGAQSDTVSMALYLEAVREASGEDAAWDAAWSWAEDHPNYPVSAFGLAYGAQWSEREGRKKRVAAKVTETFDYQMIQAQFDANMHAARARTLLVMGDIAGASAAAATAMGLNATAPAALLASSEVARAEGKGPKAKKQGERAVQIAAAHPGYQLLKTSLDSRRKVIQRAPEAPEGDKPNDKPDDTSDKAPATAPEKSE